MEPRPLTDDGEQQRRTEDATPLSSARFFSRVMKDACWKNAPLVDNRDPDRWRLDAAGNIVCRGLSGCSGIACHEYDHIIPYSRGGETSVENCQILQTRVNRSKRDKFEVDSVELENSSVRPTRPLSDADMDLIEMAVYGNVRRAVLGPPPRIATAITLCECKSVNDHRERPPNGYKPC